MTEQPIAFDEFKASMGGQGALPIVEALRVVAGPKRRTVSEWKAALAKLNDRPVPRES